MTDVGAIHPFTLDAPDLDPVMERIGDARIVLLGEATHGTHEFYDLRATITRRLIEERGFTAVAAEADWPDAWRVNRYVRGDDSIDGADDALSEFRRFPAWMWRNRDVRRFVEWLSERNRAADGPPAGFYGLDLYSLAASRDAVIHYLDRVDPDAAARARERYGCFDPYRDDLRDYGFATPFGEGASCEDEVVGQLVELRSRGPEYASRDGRIAADEHFFADWNAQVVRDAEAYYRAMYRGAVESWNLRDRHMVATLERLERHLRERGEPARIVVWAHNSHVGDARVTEMGEAGEVNVGSLARERWGDDAVLVGFTTHEGTVTAASSWDGPAQRRRVRPSRDDSYERLLHSTGAGAFALVTDEAALPPERLERAIGVIYRPESERVSHYFRARLAEQLDVVIHVDRTSAVEPLDPGDLWRSGEEVPETYPWAV